MRELMWKTEDFAKGTIAGMHIHIMDTNDQDTILRTGWATRGSDARVYVTDHLTNTRHGPYASLSFAASEYVAAWAEAHGSCPRCLGAGEMDDPMSDYTPFHGTPAYCLCEAGKEAKAEHERMLDNYTEAAGGWNFAEGYELDAGDYADFGELSVSDRAYLLSADHIAEFFDDSEILDARARR